MTNHARRDTPGLVGAVDFSPGKNTQRGLWLGDFRIENGRILAKSTGVWMKNDLQLWSDIARWLSYYAFVRAVGFLRLPLRKPAPRIWFTPHAPRPWYIIWAAAVWAGARFARSPETADAVFYFEDRTTAIPPTPTHARAFNFAVSDISKSHVAAMHERVFGYPLALDPRTHHGEAVEKGEGNGLHDGRIVQCPREPAPGRAYQHFVRTADETGAARDLRTACVGGRPVIVFDKRKLPGECFSIQNASVRARLPQDVFSAEEITKIERYCAAMRLDWGALDVLREAETGRLFVVDVNKTDTGPPVVLTWRDRALTTQLLADALVRMVSDHAVSAAAFESNAAERREAI